LLDAPHYGKNRSRQYRFDTPRKFAMSTN